MSKTTKTASAASLLLKNSNETEEPKKEQSKLEEKKSEANKLKPDTESKIELTVLKSATPSKNEPTMLKSDKIEPNVLKSAAQSKIEVSSAHKKKYEQSVITRSVSGMRSANTNDIKSARRVQNPENVKSASKSISDKNRNMVVSEYEVEKGVETIRNPFTHFKGFSSIPKWVIYLVTNLAVLAVVILIGVTLGVVYKKVCSLEIKINVII
jgi:hypothetical protein